MWTLKVSDQNRDGEGGNFIGWRLSLWGSAKDASKAGPYELKTSEELPIPFPPLPAEDSKPVPDHSTAEPSTTKSHPKPTVISATPSAQEDIETSTEQVTATSISDPEGSDIEAMGDGTRFWIAAFGSAFSVLFVCGAAIIIIRRVRKNRLLARRRREGEGESEDVRMRLLDNEAQRPVSSGPPDVLYDAEEERTPLDREHSGVASSGVGFHSGFLDEDEEDEGGRSTDRSRRYEDGESGDEAETALRDLRG